MAIYIVEGRNTKVPFNPVKTGRISQMGEKAILKNGFIQKQISPMWTKILSKAGFVDRNVLAAALNHLETSKAELVVLTTEAAVSALKSKDILKPQYDPASLKDIQPWMLKAVTVSRVEAALNEDPVFANTEKISGILESIGSAKGTSHAGTVQEDTIVKAQEEALDVADSVIPGANGIFSKLKSVMSPVSLAAVSMAVSVPSTAFAEDPAGAMQIGHFALQNSFLIAVGLKLLTKWCLPVPKTGHGFYYNFRNLLNTTLTNTVITCGAGFVLGGAPILYILAGLGLTGVSYAWHIAKVKADQVRQENAKKPQIFEEQCQFLNKKYWPAEVQDVSEEVNIKLSESGKKIKQFLTEGRMTVKAENGKDVRVRTLKAAAKVPVHILNILEELSDPTKAKTTAYVSFALSSLAAYCYLRVAGTVAIANVPNITGPEVAIGYVGAFILAMGEVGRLITSGVFIKDQDLARRSTLADYAAPNLKAELEARGLLTDYVTEKLKKLARSQGIDVDVYLNKKLSPEEIRKTINDLIRNDILPYSPISEGPRLTSRRIAAYEPNDNPDDTLKEIGIGESDPYFNTFGMVGGVIESQFLMNNKLQDHFIVIGRPIMQKGREIQSISESLDYKEAIDQMLAWIGNLKKTADTSFNSAQAAKDAQKKIVILEKLIDSIILQYRTRYETWKALAETKWRQFEYCALISQDALKTWEWHIKDWEKKLKIVKGWKDNDDLTEKEKLTKISNAFNFIETSFTRDVFIMPLNEFNHIDLSVYEDIKQNLADIDPKEPLSQDRKQAFLSTVQEKIKKYDVQDRKRIAKPRDIMAELGELADKAIAEKWTMLDCLSKAAFEAAVQFNPEAGLKAGAESGSDERFGKTFVRVSQHATNKIGKPAVKNNAMDLILRDAKQQTGKQQIDFYGKAVKYATKGNNPDIKLNADGSVSVPRFVELTKDQFIKIATEYLYKDEKEEYDRLSGLLKGSPDRLNEASSKKIIDGIIANAGLDNSKLLDRRKIRSLERLRKDLLNPMDTRMEKELLSLGLVIALSLREIEWIPWTPQQSEDQTLYVSHMDKDYRYLSKELSTGEDFDIINRGVAAYSRWEYEGKANISQIQFSQENAATEHIGPEAREGIDYPKGFSFKNGETYKFEKPYSGQSLICYGSKIHLYSQEIRDALSFGQNVDQSPWYGAFVTVFERKFMKELDNALLSEQPVTVSAFMTKLFAMKSFRELYINTYKESPIEYLRDRIVNEMNDNFGIGVLDQNISKETGDALIERIRQNMLETAQAVGIMPGRNMIAANICCGTPRLIRHTISQVGYLNYFIPDASGKIIGKIRTSFGKSESSRNSGEKLPVGDPRKAYDSKETTGEHELIGYDARWYAAAGGTMPTEKAQANNRHVARQLNRIRKLSVAEVKEMSDHFDGKGQKISLNGEGDKIIVRDKATNALVCKFWYYHPEMADNNEKEIPVDQESLKSFKSLGLIYERFDRDEKGNYKQVIKQFTPVAGKELSYKDLPQGNYYEIRLGEEAATESFIVAKDYVGKAKTDLGRIAKATFEQEDIPGTTDVKLIRNISIPRVQLTYVHDSGKVEQINPVIETTPFTTITEDMEGTIKQKQGGVIVKAYNIVVGRGEGPLDLSMMLPQQDRWALGGMQVFQITLRELLKSPTLLFSKEGLRRIASYLYYPHGFLDQFLRVVPLAFFAFGMILPKGMMLFSTGPLFMYWLLAYLASNIGVYAPNVYKAMKRTSGKDATMTVIHKEEMAKVFGATWSRAFRHALQMDAKGFAITMANAYTDRKMAPVEVIDGVSMLRMKQWVKKMCKGIKNTDLKDIKNTLIDGIDNIDSWRTRMWMSGIAMGMGLGIMATKYIALGISDPFDSFAVFVNTVFPTLDYLLLRAGINRYYGGVVEVKDEKGNVLGVVHVGGLVYLGYDRKIQKINDRIINLNNSKQTPVIIGNINRLHEKKQALETKRNNKVMKKALKELNPGVVKRTLKKVPGIRKMFKGQLDVDHEVKSNGKH